MNNIKIITTSTRQGRKGIAVAKWITALAKENDKYNYNIELLDLAEINLLFMDEPIIPVFKVPVRAYKKME